MLSKVWDKFHFSVKQTLYLDEEEVKQLLSKEYGSDWTVDSDSGSVGADMVVGGCQLLHHLIAFKLLCQTGMHS